MLTLVPLAGDGVYLVQADRRVNGGDYALSVGREASSVSVGAPIAQPERVGTLTAEPSTDGCEDSLRFQMTDRASLAYAPLARFTVSIDAGEEQLWVDYGALSVTVAAEGNAAEFVLPRCGPLACLPEGLHQLTLRMDIAGVDAQPAASSLDFEVHCPLPETEPGTPGDTDPACSFSAPPSSSAATALTLAALLGVFLGRRRGGAANLSAAP